MLCLFNKSLTLSNEGYGAAGPSCCVMLKCLATPYRGLIKSSNGDAAAQKRLTGIGVLSVIEKRVVAQMLPGSNIAELFGARTALFSHIIWCCFRVHGSCYMC